MIDGFLPVETCALILEELAYSFWRPSGVVQRTGGADRKCFHSAERVSESSEERWFSAQLRQALGNVDIKLETVLPGFGERREAWQATRYGKDGRYDSRAASSISRSMR